jgi:hypothetical protein
MMPLEQRAFVLRTADRDDDDGMEEDDAGDDAAELYPSQPRHGVSIP